MQGRHIAIGFGIIILVFVVYKVFTFKLFDSELVFLEKLPVEDADYSIAIYKFPSSATIEGSIQVHLMQDDTGESKLYKNYDKYNTLESSKISRDTVLSLAMKRSTSNIIDTVNIKLPKNYKLSLSPIF